MERIELPTIVPTDSELWSQRERDTFFMGVGSKARFSICIHQPDRILADVFAEGAHSEDALALSFLVTVLPHFLPAFDLEPFHGSGVIYRDKALGFFGSSKAGKSSVARALIRAGATLIADDCVAVDDELLVHPAPPVQRLRLPIAEDEQVLKLLEGRAYCLAPSSDRSRRLDAIFLLTRGSTSDLRRIDSLEAATGLLKHVRAPRSLKDIRQVRQLRLLRELALNTTTYEMSLAKVEDVVGLIKNLQSKGVDATVALTR